MKKYSIGLLIITIIISLSTKAQVVQKYFGGPGLSGFASRSAQLKSSTNRVVVGAKTSPTAYDNAFITCIDATDRVLWSKEISTAQQDRFMSVSATADGGCVAVGYVNQAIGTPYSDNQACVYKFDATGTLLWNKIFKASSTGELFYAVIEDPINQNIYCAGLLDFGSSLNSGIIVCLNSAGTVLWSNSYLMPRGNQIMDMVYHKNKIVCAGFFRGSTYYDGQIFAVSASDGSVLWNRAFEYTSSYYPSNQTQWGDRIQVVNDKFYMDCFLSGTWGSAPVTPTLVRFDSSGLNAICLEYPITGVNHANVIHSKIISENDIYLFQHTSTKGWDRLQSSSPLTDITDVVITKIKDINNPTTSKVFTRGFSTGGSQAILGTEFTGTQLIGLGAAKDDPGLIGSQDIFKFSADTSLTPTPTNCLVDISGQTFSNPLVSNTATSFTSVTTPIFITPVVPSVTTISYSSAAACATSVANDIVPDFDFIRSDCNNFIFTDKTTTSSSGIATWRWSFGDGNQDAVQHPTHRYLIPGTYLVKLLVTDSLGNLDSISKTISFSFNRFAKAHPDTSFCLSAGKSLALKLWAEGGVSYLWTPKAGLDDSLIATPTSTITGSINYVVRVTDSAGCIDFDTVSITVIPSIANVSVTPKEINACLGDEVQLNATGATQYQWFPYVGLSKDTGSNPILYVSGVNRYIVVGKDELGCTDSDTVLVSALPKPNVKISSEYKLLSCNKTDVRLSGSGASTYEWSPAIYCEDSKSATTLVRPPLTTTFTLTGTNEFGCESKDTITVFFDDESDLRIPNAFTPNGDGINDRVKPIYTCNFILTEFCIYNRWGNLVFSTTNINQAWDGTFNGVACNSGVFYYYIKGKNNIDKEKLYKGDITLVR